MPTFGLDKTVDSNRLSFDADLHVWAPPDVEWMKDLERWSRPELTKLGIVHVDVTDRDGTTTAIELEDVLEVTFAGNVGDRSFGYVQYRTERMYDGVGVRVGTIRMKVMPSKQQADPPCRVRLPETEYGHGGSFAAQTLQMVIDRGDDYAHPAENHQLTADLFSHWFSRRFGVDLSFTAEDVCVINALQKLSRLAHKTKDDSWLDVMGYAENVSMLRDEQRNRRPRDGSTGAGSSPSPS